MIEQELSELVSELRTEMLSMVRDEVARQKQPIEFRPTIEQPQALVLPPAQVIMPKQEAPIAQFMAPEQPPPVVNVPEPKWGERLPELIAVISELLVLLKERGRKPQRIDVERDKENRIKAFLPVY